LAQDPISPRYFASATMAKGQQRSNSPKKSRRGRRSPKKSNKGVHKKINKSDSEPVQLHLPKDVEELDCECDLENEADVQQKLPKMADEVPVADVSTIKADLVQFFWDSFEEDARASLMSLSQHEEQFFLFGKVGAELAKSGKFTPEVESNLAMVWKADEAWIRSLLASEVELPKPEEPEAPMEQVEETVEAETVEEAPEAAVEAEGTKDEVEVPAEVVAEAPAEAPVPEVAADLSEVVETKDVPFDVMEDKPEVEDVAMEETVHQPAAADPMAQFMAETAFNNENTAQEIAEAVKTVSAKLGEQSVDSAVEGLAPKDLNLVQPLDLA